MPGNDTESPTGKSAVVVAVDADQFDSPGLGSSDSGGGSGDSVNTAAATHVSYEDQHRHWRRADGSGGVNSDSTSSSAAKNRANNVASDNNNDVAAQQQHFYQQHRSGPAPANAAVSEVLGDSPSARPRGIDHNTNSHHDIVGNGSSSNSYTVSPQSGSGSHSSSGPEPSSTVLASVNANTIAIGASPQNFSVLPKFLTVNVAPGLATDYATGQHSADTGTDMVSSPAESTVPIVSSGLRGSSHVTVSGFGVRVSAHASHVSPGTSASAVSVTSNDVSAAAGTGTASESDFSVSLSVANLSRLQKLQRQQRLKQQHQQQ